ncbi:CHAD domain-containing protein [Thiomicrorhabdus sp. zzn3]|uniref:CHAD domain-containing protein n=1 Tax=Thiomicrorhabdus sp. zzn3 TaxID=3039775 RepID=UPI00243650FA|nr:CHAD domain-containing protein [Thiomicrorhabdus sp. zzn3]MDG6778731.1 CHAD domain-containing protein [Thiomicrorhabdus sp. zzn3]
MSSSIPKPYFIHTDKPVFSTVPEQLRLYIIEQLDQALAVSHSEQRESIESIHDLRVLCKRLRAYWRLLRECVPSDTYHAAETRLCLTAKKLAGARDQAVLMASLQQLSLKVAPSVRLLVAEWIQGLKEEAKKEQEAWPIDWALVIAELEQEKSTWRALDCGSGDEQSGYSSPNTSKKVAKGLKRTSKRSFKLAQKSLDKKKAIRQRHQWRKWVKYQFYQWKWLWQHHVIDTKEHKKAVKQLDALGELLGQEHDFELQQSFLALKETAFPQYQDEIEELKLANRQRLKTLKKQIKQQYQKLLKHLD